MRANSRTAIALALATAVVFGSGASAHRRDELLQAARIDIEPDRVELGLDLTPGIAVAEAFIADLDRNRDGSLSPHEQTEYVRQVFGAIHLEVDGHPLHVEPVSSTFAGFDALRRGEGAIHLQSAVTVPRFSNGNHQLSFRNAHRPDVSVYLANALVPDSDRVAVTAQHRDVDQRDLTIDFVVRASAASTPVLPLSVIAGASVLAALVRRRINS